MITWLIYWPILVMPSVLMSAVAALPTTNFNDKTLGGGPVREFYVNNLLIPFLPHDAAMSLVSWFSQASILQEWFLSVCIAINVNATLLPFLYTLGVVLIKISSWFHKKNIELKRQGLR